MSGAAARTGRVKEKEIKRKQLRGKDGGIIKRVITK